MKIRKEREQSVVLLDREREQFSKEREANRTLMASIHDLQAGISNIDHK